MATALPTSPSGQTDYNTADWSTGYASVVDAMLEYVPDLTWPLSIRTYNRMRWDPQLKAVMSAYTLPIRRAAWAVDGKDCNPKVTAEVADNLGLPVLGEDDSPTAGYRRRGFQFGQHLRLALLDLTFGHMPFSRWYDLSSGRARIAGVAERMPQTIEMIHLSKDGTGAIEYVEQGVSTQVSPSNRISANELVWYSHEKEGSAWTGQSLLRAAYPAWLIKHELWRVHATSIRRFGMGVPEVQAPPGAQPNQIIEASRLAAGIRGGNTSGVGLPNGFTFNLKGMTGSVPDALGFINYLDKQMTRATLTSLLDMTDTTHGSRALGETFMDLLLLSLQTIADEHAEQATAQLVVPLVDANWGEDEPAPRIVCGDVGSQHEVTAQTLQLLVSCNALEPDPALDKYIREQYKLPDRTTPWVGGSPTVPDPMGTYPHGANAPVQDPSVVPGETPATVAASSVN